MRTLRAILAATVVAAAIAAMYRSAWLRYRCEVEKKSSDDMVRLAMEKGGFEGEQRARAAMARLRPCLNHNPSDYQVLTIYGLAAEAAGQKDLALAMYKSALRLNARPELYVNVGLLLLEKGQVEEARQNFLRATEFNVAYLGSVSEELQRELVAEMETHRRDVERRRKRELK